MPTLLNSHRSVAQFVFATAFLARAIGGAQPDSVAATDVVAIQVHAGQRANYTLPRTLFGTFLEPIGNSTYNGLWAEILQNPSFEENLWNAEGVARMIHDQPALAEASRLGLPLPWEPLNPKQGNRYEPRWGDAANSWRSLVILGLPGAKTGIRQQVYLPVHRELRYKASVYAKRLSGDDGLEISIRARAEQNDVLAVARIGSVASEWQKYTVDLAVPAGKLQSLEPADFVIQVQGNGRVQVDQASLVPDDAIDGLDPEMVQMAKDMKTPLMRFGGNYTSSYHWRDGIGPMDKRVSMLNLAWGMPEYNQFGTDEFLQFCKLIGAQPQIALNLGSGTPEEAAGWVQYVNQHWVQHEGLLWELGNELWGNWNLGYPTLDELAARTRKFSEAVQKVDPEARLIATGRDPDVFKKWNAAQLTNPAGTFNFVSTHFVVTTDKVATEHPTPDFLAQAAFALPVQLGRQLREMQAQIDEAPQFKGKTHIAFTEWLFVCCRGGRAEAPRFDNMGGALGAAGFLNMLIQNADVVPISDMTGGIEFAGIWKKRSRVYAVPAYYAFRMYSSAAIDQPVAVQNGSPTYDVHQGVTRLPEIANVPYLDVVAALNQSGDRLTLFCVNRHLSRDFTADISLDGFKANGKAEIEKLYAGSIYDTNSEEEPGAVQPIQSTANVSGSKLHMSFRHESITRIELYSR